MKHNHKETKVIEVDLSTFRDEERRLKKENKDKKRELPIEDVKLQ